MKKIFPFLTILFFAFMINANAQKASPDYKISAIKIVPYEQNTGQFEDEITAGSDTNFFNELGKGLFVTVEVSGKAGSYEAKRNVEITVMEGKKLKLKKVLMMGILNQSGKYYLPIFLEPAMCDEVKITAKITGQKTPSITTRKVAFMCGE